VDWHLLQACAFPCLAERIGGQEDHATAIRSGRGFGTPKARQEAGQGDFRSIQLSNKTIVQRDQAPFAGPASPTPPAQPSYRCTCSWTPHACRAVATPQPRALENGCRQGDRRLTSPVCHQKTWLPDKELRHKGSLSRDAPHCRDAARPLITSRPVVVSQSMAATARHEGYANQSNARRGIESIGVDQTVGGLRQ